MSTYSRHNPESEVVLDTHATCRSRKPALPYQGWARPTESSAKRERRLAELSLNYELHARDAAFRARASGPDEEDDEEDGELPVNA